VTGLRKGRSSAKDHAPVEPVAQPLIDAVLPLVPRQVKALIELQLTMGARPGELIRLRPIDIDRSQPLWEVKLNEHKTAHHGKARTLWFGHNSQPILNEFITSDRPVHMPLFSPREADEEFRAKKRQARKTPLSCGNKATAKKPRPQLGDHYTVSGYRQAIRRACLKAFPYPPGVDKVAWRKEHVWHPHQLRHNWFTKMVNEFGVGVTQTAGGHARGSAITAIYSNENVAEAKALMLKIG
jgi:integrase